jgi:uncharacterized protein (TIGR02246 family)
MTARSAQRKPVRDTAAEEAAIRAIPMHMIEAWNAGDAAAFAAAFSDTADFVAFEGTHLKGRRAIVEFHQPLFDTQLKGTRLEGDVQFVRFLTPDVAVMHARCGVILAGRDRPIASRESMQLFVAQRNARAWRVEAMLNARRLTLEQQTLADDLESLAPAEQRSIADRMRFLRDGLAEATGGNAP